MQACLCVYLPNAFCHLSSFAFVFFRNFFVGFPHLDSLLPVFWCALPSFANFRHLLGNWTDLCVLGHAEESLPTVFWQLFQSLTSRQGPHLGRMFGDELPQDRQSEQVDFCWYWFSYRHRVNCHPCRLICLYLTTQAQFSMNWGMVYLLNPCSTRWNWISVSIVANKKTK